MEVSHTVTTAITMRLITTGAFDRGRLRGRGRRENGGAGVYLVDRPISVSKRSSLWWVMRCSIL